MVPELLSVVIVPPLTKMPVTPIGPETLTLELAVMMPEFVNVVTVAPFRSTPRVSLGANGASVPDDEAEMMPEFKTVVTWAPFKKRPESYPGPPPE